MAAELHVLPSDEATPLEPMFAGAEPASHRDYLEHPLYDRYMRLPKGLVGSEQASVLRDVHEGLAAEEASGFLVAGGWAAAEAALVIKGVRNKTRQQLVESAGDSWLRAHDRLVAVAETGEETDFHYSLKQRVELALASIPLLEGLIEGDVRVKTLQRVTDGYLQVGIDNVALGREKRQAGDITRACFHDGLSYEILGLLGLNDEMTTRRFAMPSTARNDAGYYERRLTHDLMIFNQRAGRVTSVLPTEVKSMMSRHDRRRYHALVIDGRVMDVLHAGEPGPMMDLFARVYRGDGSQADSDVIERMTGDMWDMVAQYSSGSRLAVGGESVVEFHDASKVRLGGYAVRGVVAA